MIQRELNHAWIRPSELVVKDECPLAYAFEITDYMENELPPIPKSKSYKTDLIIKERGIDNSLKPRVVVEMKLKNITTHAAITYSKKAFDHKTVFPHLRYGILLGESNEKALPNPLFRHGPNFDFMLAWKRLFPSPHERNTFIATLIKEVEASHILEHISSEEAKRKSTHYTAFHRQLVVI